MTKSRRWWIATTDLHGQSLNRFQGQQSAQDPEPRKTPEPVSQQGRDRAKPLNINFFSETESLVDFSAFEAFAKNGNRDKALGNLAEILEEKKQYSAWFEALKMRARHNLGLEIWSGDQDGDLPISVQRQLEDCLVDACQIVGEAMIKDGHIRDGWMYLRPVGDAKRAKQLLHSILPDDDNTEQIIDVAIGQGVSPAWGFQLTLNRMGTCNAITAYDTQMHSAALTEKQEAAGRLIEHVYDELVSNVKHHLAKTLPIPPGKVSLAELISGRPELFADGGYHIDVTHLSSVLRIGRIVDDSKMQQLAIQLCEYGKQLAELFQPPGHLPFEPYFESHRLYYSCLVGDEDAAQGLDFFKQQRAKATLETKDPTNTFSLETQMECTEVVVELLVRTHNPEQAIELLIQQLDNSAEHQRSRWTPILFNCCQQAGDFTKLMEYSRKTEDALGFGLAAIYAQPNDSKA